MPNSNQLQSLLALIGGMSDANSQAVTQEQDGGVSTAACWAVKSPEQPSLHSQLGQLAQLLRPKEEAACTSSKRVLVGQGLHRSMQKF